MKHTEILRKNQLHLLLEFWNIHKANMSEDKTAVDVFTKFEAFQTSLNDLEAKQKLQGKWITVDKQDQFDALIAITSKCNDLLIVYGNLNQFSDFSEITGANKNKLVNGSFSNVLTQARKILGIIQDNSEKATLAGITEDLKKELSDSIPECDQLIDKPRNFKKSKHTITQQISQIIVKFIDLQDNNLLRYMRAKYQDSNPELYTAYMEAAEIDHSARQKILLKGKFTDQKGLSIRKVKVIIDGKDVGLHGGTKGGYFFTKLPKGHHEIVFHKKGYLSQTRNVVILADRCVSLDVAFATVGKEEALLV